MIKTSDEIWATDTLRDAQDPGAGHQEWPGLNRITLERYNLIFSQQHSRGYSSTGQPQHDAGMVLENSLATLFKIALDTDLKLTKWSVANGLVIDDATIVADANISDTARPCLWLAAAATATVTVFYVDEDDDYIHYVQSTDGAFNFGAEQNVGGQSNLKAIAAVSASKVHCVSYANGNSRFHFFEDDGGWSETNSLIYWPHKIEHIDAITIGNRDLIVFYSNGPMFGNFREAGIYGIWEKHGRWSDIFKIDVLDEADANSYRKEPMISTANGIYFLTGYLSEGDEDYSHTTRFLKTSKDGQHWSQYQPLVTTPEAGPAKMLIVNAASGQSWPFSTGQQVYIAGYDKVYESDATRLVGEENADLQVNVSSRTLQWSLSRGVISQASTVLSNYDGALDAHAIINDDNTLLLKREAGYHTGAGDEYAQLSIEAVDVIKETDRLPKRHKQVVSRDFMAWMRDREADHHEEWESQLVGYDTYQDDTETGYGGLSHTATQKGWWKTDANQLWLVSDNKEGIAFATWDSRIMNGQHKAMIRIETSGNDEYAGLIFRARDAANFWAAYYDQDDDKIHLRKRIADAWDGIVASSSALGWSIDTFYGLMVDFRYSYFRVFYSTDGLAWTQAFTYSPLTDPLAGAFEYGYVGLIGYGYSDQDEDDPPDYTPPTPPPPPTPPTGEGDGNLLYLVDNVNNEVYRTRNARAGLAADVVYEALSFPGTDPRYITLDSWNPRNGAMVCGNDGVWKTTNLDASPPTWTHVIDTTNGDLDSDWRAYMAASSICQEGLWMVAMLRAGVYDDVYVFWTTTGGATYGDWSNVRVDDASHQSGPWPKIECSSHNAQVAWITSRRNVGSANFYKTTDQWSSHASTNVGSGSWPANPHHRYLSNPDDNLALWVYGSTTRWCTDDCCTCTDGTIGGGGVWCGSYTWGTNKYWILTGTATKYFYVSDDAATWTLQHTFTGTTRFISGFSYDPDRFYACQDGTTAPLLLSQDRGETWQEQTGNWADVQGGSSPDILCCVPVWL